jgi:mevalonate kinase
MTALAFAYSVPTKVILFGEHAVVHGHPAVAIAINNRMFMKGSLTESRTPEVFIRFQKDSFSFNPTDAISPDSSPLHRLYRTSLSMPFPVNRRLSLTFSIPRETTGGLGTSAALSVLLVAAARRLEGLPVRATDMFEPAKRLECFFHANSSGLDVATVLRGSAVRFQRGEFTPIAVPEFPLLIVDAGVPRKTSTAVERVRAMLDREPARVGGILEELGAFADGFARADRKEEFAVNHFAPAQEKLSALGLSCPEIDEIVSRATKAGLTAKISGAGMGGIVLVAGNGVFEKEELFNPFAHFRASADAVGLREEAVL